MKIATIIGARPQFIKAAVVSRAISAYNQSTTAKSIPLIEVIVHTGQHYDRNMSDVFFEEMHIPQPDYFLDTHGLSHGAMTGQMLEKIEAVLLDEKPDCVLVYGDTNTTLAGALAAVKLHIPVAHVEAGLRSFNRKMPEEVNRVLTDHASNFLFCPTQHAVRNLNNEGIGLGSSSTHKLVSSSEHLKADESSAVTMNSPTHELKSSLSYDLANSKTNPSTPSPTRPLSLASMSSRLAPKVALVGDVMLDAAFFYKKFARNPQFSIPDKFILSTIHRAENTDNLDRLKSIFIGFEKISQEIPIILPLHPRTRKKIRNYNQKKGYSVTGSVTLI
ncbi:UDP-2,3-diacetamido-2,3-dideoxy-D-glucuronic acid 2-epimerase (EC [Olavius algarvensis Delta 1 endosymbiont]|nr:UDP-2,3-diacetamido-2,3-dideoxy-D-glucuronic acid 2-epimerase (EC [Olavius algarvensis Delta 1 endosymbiont]